MNCKIECAGCFNKCPFYSYKLSYDRSHQQFINLCTIIICTNYCEGTDKLSVLKTTDFLHMIRREN